ncbi:MULTISPECIES: magnesium/cobalt transporter CorA [unclassified Bacillus (in: firmicutes)]|uniref:magnesium/cobalt transporter CorA n=1 Tax=unclassified Bacillus (in: firmicutes) TaxID=185979 RepID=UPI0008ED65AC|nr:MULTISPECIES: magnesium/cobalt transporter CorA [unclassified Bacillus (in: firmicutes)]SFA76922.1 magnesium transporter [Bacillus sp. UNCCL13]SFQ66793.1 magnesium transporter [Bacillus sp. cl95]
MIKICALKGSGEVVNDLTLEETKNNDVKWFWVDFSVPTVDEQRLLASHFDFHPLSIEDCIDEFSQRPKLDFYEEYLFLVIHAVNEKAIMAEEVDIFVSEKFVVTFHKKELIEVEQMWDRLKNDKQMQEGPFSIMHAIIDKVVDDYFPSVYLIEEELNRIEDNSKDESMNDLMEQLFDLRTDLSRMRRSVIPMRDLLYRIVQSERLSFLKDRKVYFNDVHDHLLKIVEMIESYREFSSDIRDSYLSVNSNRMNSIMMTLTVITTIFMPLTFIAGVYGMNFTYMPELEWKYGYFFILIIMLLIAITMFIMFQAKGWFRFGKQPKKKSRHIHLR